MSAIAREDVPESGPPWLLVASRSSSPNRSPRSGAKWPFCVGTRGSVLSVIFSSDGRRAVSGWDDNTLRLWDCANGRELTVLRGHKALVNGLAFSADGMLVLGAQYSPADRRTTPHRA
jgi:WD40 repeat protein